MGIDVDNVCKRVVVGIVDNFLLDGLGRCRVEDFRLFSRSLVSIVSEEKKNQTVGLFLYCQKKITKAAKAVRCLFANKTKHEQSIVLANSQSKTLT